MKRRLFLVLILVLAAGVIAFLLRDVVEVLIIRPAAYLFWFLGVIYRYIPQPILWAVFVIFMLYQFLGRMVVSIDFPGSRPGRLRQIQGPVGDLANLIQRKDGGVYFKWKIARTLAQIASEMQELRLNLPTRKLNFNGKTVNPQVRRYLEAGQSTSFSDYPISRARLPIPGLAAMLGKVNLSPFINLPVQSARPTPFDGDIDPVIDYLESELENENDIRRP